jgi:hypothetical protein
MVGYVARTGNIRNAYRGSNWKLKWKDFLGNASVDVRITLMWM